jgi:hypothetical protein
VTTVEMAHILDALYEHRAPNLPIHALADVLDRLLWCLDDNGAALLRVREQWLVGDDKGRIELALAMNESYPFSDAQRMREVLATISRTWPDLAARCEAVIAKRRQEYGD